MTGQALVKLGAGAGDGHREIRDEGRPDMAWTWRYSGADDGAPQGADLPEEAFTSRGDAESWLGEHWRELADAGVERVALMDGDRETYAMSLEETA